MKRKKIVLAIVAIIALIISIATGYTFSKFYQSVQGSVALKLKTWVFNVTTNDGKPLSEISLQNADGSAIEPGNSGSFEINIDATNSDVDIVYSTIVSNENLPKSMKFYLSTDYSTVYEDLSNLLNTNLKGELTKDGTQKAKYTVFWEWPYEGIDDRVKNDSPTDNYGFDIQIIGQQKKKQ